MQTEAPLLFHNTNAKKSKEDNLILSDFQLLSIFILTSILSEAQRRKIPQYKREMKKDWKGADKAISLRDIK